MKSENRPKTGLLQPLEISLKEMGPVHHKSRHWSSCVKRIHGQCGLQGECDILLINSICVHVPMSPRARASAPDGWLEVIKGRVYIKVLDMVQCMI